jgi:hypothetical protein
MLRYLTINTLTALLIPFMISCGSSKKMVGLSINSLPPLQESIINIPVKIYAKPFLAKAESNTPLQFTSTGWPDFLTSGCDFRYKYRFIRSGFRFTCVNNKAVITMLGNYQLAGSKAVCAFGKQVSPWVSGSCGFSPESMRRVEINIGSSFNFQPDYTIRSHSGVDKISALDKCTITVLNTDITDLVTDSIRSSVNAFASSLDQTVSGINYAALVTRIGIAVGKKVALSTYGFIKINPSAVHINALNYSKDTLYLVAGFSCFPDVSSDSINHVITNFLPPLSSAALNPGFIINTNATYDYHFIDTLLTRFVKNRPFEIEGKNIYVQNITIRGLDENKVELRFDFTGSKSGTLYLTGTPALDTDKQIISIPDLDYSLRSRDLILTLGKTFFNQKILHNIREKTVIKTGDIYRQNKTRLDSAFNRQLAANVFTSGYTQQVKVTGLVVKKDNLLFQVSASGMMGVIVK